MEAAAEGPLWFEPRSGAWATEFLRRLASLASAAPFGTAWLVALRSGLAGPVVVANDRVAREVVSAAGSPLPGRLRAVGSGALGVPGPQDRFAVVCRGARAAPAATPGPSDGGSGATPGPGAPAAGPDEPPEGGLQSHWFSTGTGRLAVRLRVWARARAGPETSALRLWALPAVERLALEGVPLEVREVAASGRRRRAWQEGRIGGFAAGPLERLRPLAAAESVRGPDAPVRIDDAALARHVVVVGASGSGKTSLLAELAARRIAAGRSVLAVDLHGDLGPSIAAGLDAGARARLVAVDATGVPGSIRGVRLLGRSDECGADPREVPHLVAALKRLTSDSGDVYWGFRLERTLESFVRLAHEEGGGLADLHALLTDVHRRDAARASTRSPTLATFLDELPALLRRNPEYLVPAVSRVAKVSLEPRLLALLDATGPSLSVPALVAEGRSVVWRVPFAELGPEAATFAATLLVTHAYLGLAAQGVAESRAVFVVDEASALSPRLVTELLTEARKFGIGVVLATQYPSRLAPDARAASEGAAGSHVVFRVPAPAAAETAAWAGLDRSASAMLSSLPDGTAWVVRSGDGGGRGVIQVPPGPGGSGEVWAGVVRRTACDGERPGAAPSYELEDAIVFAVAGGARTLEEVARSAAGDGRRSLDARAVSAAIEPLERRGWLRSDEGLLTLTEAGNRYLGMGAPSGAATESAEHRALLDRALAILARRGVRLEPVRQGRFDRRLPDAIVRQLPGPVGHRVPAELGAEIDSARTTWAWTYFAGRDVHVEAEVSGALRPERIRRDLAKARDRGAFALFLVPDAGRARKVRSVLAAEGAGRGAARVWTLPGRPRVGQAAGSPAAGDGAAADGPLRC